MRSAEVEARLAQKEKVALDSLEEKEREVQTLGFSEYARLETSKEMRKFVLE